MVETNYTAWNCNTGESIAANTPKDLWHALDHCIRHDKWWSGEQRSDLWYIQLTKRLVWICI